MKKAFYTWLLTASLAAAMMPAGEAWAAWTNLGGGDHSGANWTPSNNVRIAGNHTNIGTFTVDGGKTIFVEPWNGANYGNVTINATNITVAGTLTAAGAGYGGGGGGGGGVGAQANGAPPIPCRPYTNGAAGAGTRGGANGTLGTKGFGVNGYSIGGAGGGGGGSFGGVGAVAIQTRDIGEGERLNGNMGGRGGYAIAGGQGDGSTNTSLRMGSGGGGGGGGASAHEWMYSSIGGSGGGGAGGSGGGFIALIASNALTVSGTIQTNGLGGGNGGAGSDGHAGTSLQCDLNGSGGAGGNASINASGSGAVGVWGYYVRTAQITGICAMGGPTRDCWGVAIDPRTSESHQGGNGGAGGNGAGGGLLLKADTLSVTGGATLNGRGSNNDGVNAGTLKAFYCSLTGVVPTGNYGRYYQSDSSCFSDSGLRYRGTSGTISIAAKTTGTSQVRLYNKIGGVNKTVHLATVATADAKASKLRVKLPDGTIKALRVYP